MATDPNDRICWRTGCRSRATHQAHGGAFHCDAHRLFDWTEDRVTELRLLDAKGMSAGQISKHFGSVVSRSAVMSKLRRIGITNPDRVKRRKIGRDINQRASNPRVAAPCLPGAAPKAKADAPAPKPDSWKPRLVAVPVEARPTQLRDLHPGQCRWPLDDPGPGNMDRTLFCAAPAEGSYCGCHARVAFNARPATGPKSANELVRSLRRYA